MSLNKNFFIGAAVGVALAMAALQVAGAYLDRRKVELAQVHMRAPRPTPAIERFPRPWLPKQSSRLHDDWRLVGWDGKPIRLADFRGKVVFLNFWGTSCPPCLAEMPAIERLFGSLRSREVAFLAVTQEDRTQVRRFLKNHSFTIPIYFAGEELPEDFDVHGVPATVILDTSGAAVFRYVGGLNWDDDGARQYIRSLAAQPAQQR